MNHVFVPDGDPAIDDVRLARHELCAKFDNDPARLIAYMRERESRNPERLISFESDPVVLIPGSPSVDTPTNVVAVSSGV